MAHLLGISGALRQGSTNTKLVHEAARHYDAQAFVLADLRLPLFDADLQAKGMPPEVQRLSDQIADAEAVVISTPEYNKAPPGVLKNALDWVSRTKGAPWKDKPVAIMSAADGRAGGERSQFALRLMMNPFQARVLPGPEVFVADSGTKFDEDGRLTDEVAEKLLVTLMDRLRSVARQ